MFSMLWFISIISSHLFENVKRISWNPVEVIVSYKAYKAGKLCCYILNRRIRIIELEGEKERESEWEREGEEGIKFASCQILSDAWKAGDCAN